MRKPIQLSPLSPAQIEERHAVYRTTQDVRLRTRAHIILLAAEQGMRAPTMAQMVRANEQTAATGSHARVPQALRGSMMPHAWGRPRK